jgi:hypothetical protein
VAFVLSRGAECFETRETMKKRSPRARAFFRDKRQTKKKCAPFFSKIFAALHRILMLV